MQEPPSATSEEKEIAMATAAMLQPHAASRIGVFNKPRAAVIPAQTVCSRCALRTMCLPCGVEPEFLGDMDELVYSRRLVRRGDHLFHAGESLRSLYALRSGFFKTYVNASDGTTQVIGFPMAGDVVGLDGIESDRHRFNVVALDDGELCVMPYAHLQEVAARSPVVQRQVHRLMSREIVRDQNLMMLLGSMRAEARIAAFLLGLSKKFSTRGYSSVEFNLRMTRDEIGSYLGLKLETVSRLLSRFHDEGWLKVQFRTITILDLAALQRLVPDF
jgi:CRP/FNR family transcriptional regulator